MAVSRGLDVGDVVAEAEPAVGAELVSELALASGELVSVELVADELVGTEALCDEPPQAVNAKLAIATDSNDARAPVTRRRVMPATITRIAIL
jgi:hypothetical protein